ncbi:MULTISPECIES: hypothetical protein [unclassified Nocardiopsis]|uniref:hypothetical protein n=1 Tax=unclassified Nocardiopsis TaxID=2649073 RepID=UPI00135804DA|nr:MULTISPECIES: hypothetical protein [unclassified Nocardiopsis]
MSGGTSGSDTPAPRREATPAAPERAPAPPSKKAASTSAQVAVVDEDTAPVKVGPGVGERLGRWAKDSFVPPEIWNTDRPSLSKQFAYAREGAWGPEQGWARKAALVAFFAVSLPTSIAAYALEWIGERPTRWITALVLLSLTWQIPYAPEVLGVLVRVPAWPITATWSALSTWF